MLKRRTGGVRAIALLGPSSAGKTSLLEALLTASGSSERQVGDGSPEAKARGQSVELNLASFEFMGDRYAVIDCPGSVDFGCDGDCALPAVDLALLVCDPDPARAPLLQPMIRQAEAQGVPHAIFVNKIDQARGSILDLIAALQPMSRAPLVARQLPIRKGERVTGFVDLALERAYVYRQGTPAERIDIPDDLVELESEARFHMLEQLAEHDDVLLEQLLTDVTPDPDAVFDDIVRDVGENLIVPVFFGSAQNGFGVGRLLKALRHDTPWPEAAASRVGAEDGVCAYVFKTTHAGQTGKLALSRVFGGRLADGADAHSARRRPRPRERPFLCPGAGDPKGAPRGARRGGRHR